MKLTNTHIVIIGAILLLVAIVAYKEYSSKENYIRSSVYGNCTFTRSPVDYAFKESSLKSWPHIVGDNTTYYQPAEHGIDFYPYTRKMNATGGVMGQELTNNYKGHGDGEMHIPNDSKTRFDLTNVGDVGARRVLDAEWDPAFGEGHVCSELDRVRESPHDRLYGGSNFLTADKLGE